MYRPTSSNEISCNEDQHSFHEVTYKIHEYHRLKSLSCHLDFIAASNIMLKAFSVQVRNFTGSMKPVSAPIVTLNWSM